MDRNEVEKEETKEEILQSLPPKESEEHTPGSPFLRTVFEASKENLQGIPKPEFFDDGGESEINEEEETFTSIKEEDG